MGGSTPCPLKSLNLCISCCNGLTSSFLSTGKPSPPCFIDVDRRVPFKYQLSYYNSSCSPHLEDGADYYITEILVRHNQNRRLCTCTKSFTYLNFDMSDIVMAYEKFLSFRVASSVGGVLSDFLPFVNQTTSSCEVPLVIDSKSCLFTGCRAAWMGGIL